MDSKYILTDSGPLKVRISLCFNSMNNISQFLLS